MLEKLLSLLIQAKGGAISGVLLLGATGALVSVSAQNGVTTITITQASASPSTGANPARLASASPKVAESPSQNSLTSPTQATACNDQEQALALQVQRVQSAFKTSRQDLMKLRGQRAASTLEQANATLEQIHRAAVKAIEATLTCTTSDEDEDETETDETTTSGENETENDESDDAGDEDSAKATSPITFSGTDPKAIADQAILAMQTAVGTAKNAAASTPKPARTPEHQKHETSDSEHDD